MGHPVKILDVAQLMIRRSGREIDVIFTGLRPGEKSQESLWGLHEVVEPTEHDLITQTQVPYLSAPLEWGDVQKLPAQFLWELAKER
jgi:dTDP-glucose 4,6-dehydratase